MADTVKNVSLKNKKKGAAGFSAQSNNNTHTQRERERREKGSAHFFFERERAGKRLEHGAAPLARVAALVHETESAHIAHRHGVREQIQVRIEQQATSWRRRTTQACVSFFLMVGGRGNK